MKKTDSRNMRQEFMHCQAAIEQRLSGFFEDKHAGGYAKLKESMRYSLLSGGKRIRAVICIKFCEAAGGTAENALDAACAIEMLHTYSLIHDDLPCMDNSGMRRGNPSNHITFGEFTATLAGDALQAAAFETLLASGLPPAVVIEMARILAEAAGIHGICGGQFLDLNGEDKPLTAQELTEIHSLKTAALISASARIGVTAAGGTEKQLKAAEEYALAVGLAFQVRDDVLDIVSCSEKLGKPAGSDMASNKTTFAGLMGLPACERLIEAKTFEAVTALKGAFDNPGFLMYLANMLSDREN